MAQGDVSVDAEGAAGGGDLAGKLKGFTDVIDSAIKPVSDFTGKIGDTIGQLGQIGGMVGNIVGKFGTQLFDRVSALFNQKVQALFDKLLNPIMAAVDGVLTPIFDVLSAALMPVVAIIKILGAALGVAMLPIKMLAKVLELIFKPFELLADMFDRLSKQGNMFEDIIKQLSKIIEMPFRLIAALFQMLAAPLKLLELPLRSLTKALDQLVKMFEESAKRAEGPMKAIESLQDKAHETIDSVLSTIGKVIEDPIGGFNALVTAISGFVAAIDPTVMEMFEAAMRDLFAVIGEALRPVMYAAVDIVRKFSDALRPVLQQLAPALRELTQQIAGYLIQLIPVFIDYLQQLMPVLKEYVEQMTKEAKNNMAMLKTYNTLKDALDAAIKPLMDFVSGLIPGKKGVLTWQQQLARGVLALTAFIARLLGATEFLAGMQKSFKREMGDTKTSDARGLAAANNPAYKTIEALGKDAMLSSFVATAQPHTDGEITQSEFFKSVSEDLDKISKFSWKDMITEAIIDALRRAPKEGLTQAGREFRDDGIDIVNRVRGGLNLLPL